MAEETSSSPCVKRQKVEGDDNPLGVLGSPPTKLNNDGSVELQQDDLAEEDNIPVKELAVARKEKKQEDNDDEDDDDDDSDDDTPVAELKKRKAKKMLTASLKKEDTTNSTTSVPTLDVTVGPSRLEHVGDTEKGMTLVFPPAVISSPTGKKTKRKGKKQKQEHPAVTILRTINRLLRDLKIKRQFENWIYTHQSSSDGEKESCRQIQGGRIEIFLDAKDKTSEAFDKIIGKKLPKNAKQIILDYCRHQANQDPRLAAGYHYENFSLLVSLYKRGAQAPHLDLVHPNYQFGVMLSDHTAGTQFVKDQDVLGRVSTVEDLEKLWSQNHNEEFAQGMPDNIRKEFNKDDGAKLLLRYFGDTLIPEDLLRQSMTSPDPLPAGTLASLPGSVVHAGPASKGPRAILFFSGTPIDSSSVDPYLPDSQYNGVTLVGHLVSILWRRDSIQTTERHYLLRRLVDYIEGTSAKEAWALLGDGELKEFVKAIIKKTYRGTKDDFIRKKTTCREMTYGNDPFSTCAAVIDTSRLKCISLEDGLFTMWEATNTELPVSVYRNGYDKRIILRYKTKGDDNVSPDEYEGHFPNPKLKLTWKKGQGNRKFDGSNGIIKDAEGKIIKIYKGRRTKSD